MINVISRDDIPETHSRKTMSPTRVFAEEQLDEFQASGAEACEIAGVPDGIKPEALASCLRNAIWNHAGTRNRVKVKTRKGRIYLERIETANRVIKMPTSNPKRR